MSNSNNLPPFPPPTGGGSGIKPRAPVGEDGLTRHERVWLEALDMMLRTFEYDDVTHALQQADVVLDGFKTRFDPDATPYATAPVVVKTRRAGVDFPCALHPGPAGDCNEDNCKCH